MRHGIRIGVDVGTVRVGIAASDPHAILASPVETVTRDPDDESDIRRVLDIVRERDAIEVIIGEPIALSGRATPSTRDAIAFATRLATLSDVDVRLVDERLSTVSAHQSLRAAGRKQRQTRGVIDQVAAVVILQQALDAERSTGSPPGKRVHIDPRRQEPT